MSEVPAGSRPAGPATDGAAVPVTVGVGVSGRGGGRGVIHDIGYARYAGERRPPSTLWRVIMRHHLSYGWKTLWRFKPWLLSAVAITLVAGAVMYVSQNALFDTLRSRGAPIRFLDGVLPFTFRFYGMAAFLLTMTVAASVVARDQETGAFTFYFSRPVRPRDYVVGRLAGMLILTAIVLAAGPVLLALFRIGLARSTTDAIELIPWVGRALFVGALASLAYASVPLAMSSVAGKRTTALGLWAAYYVVVTTMVSIIAQFTWKPLAAIDLPMAVQSLAFGLWDVYFLGDGERVPVAAALVSLVGQSAIAVAVFYRQIQRTAGGAVGGGS